MRHKVCHFDTLQFNYLESIATHDDKSQRHNLCQFFDKTTQPLSIFEMCFQEAILLQLITTTWILPSWADRLFAINISSSSLGILGTGFPLPNDLSFLLSAALSNQSNKYLYLQLSSQWYIIYLAVGQLQSKGLTWNNSILNKINNLFF